MDEELTNAAKEYVAIIEKIEKTRDSVKLQSLEEKRVDLHWEIMKLMKARGIAFRDRDHATRIAIKIVKENG